MDFKEIKGFSEVKKISELKNLISDLMLLKKYSTTSFVSFNFDGIYRARKHNHFEGKLDKNGVLKKFLNESEFWNVHFSQATMGRCNEKHESIFYGADDVVTAILEVRPKEGDYVSVADFKNFFPKKDFIIMPLAKRSLSEIEHLNKLFLKYVFDVKHKEIEGFLDQLFCLTIESENDYKLSNAVSQIFFTDSFDSKGSVTETHGLIYPSIIRNKKSYCFAIKPWVVRSFFEMNYVQTLKVIKLESNKIKLELVRNGYPLRRKFYPKDSFNLKWMNPPENKPKFEILEF